MFPKEILFDWLIQCSELLAYCNSKKVIHRDPHFGNFMIDSEGQIYLMDFGTGQYLENDLVTKNRRFHGPWGYGPEALLGEDYSYNADVPYYGKEFAWLASCDDNRGHDPFHVLIGKDKNPYEGGIEGAYDRYAKLVQTKYKLTFEGADRYGPDFEKLIASMHAYDPKERPSPAEVAIAAKKLK